VLPYHSSEASVCSVSNWMGDPFSDQNIPIHHIFGNFFVANTNLHCIFLIGLCFVYDGKRPDSFTSRTGFVTFFQIVPAEQYKCD